VWSILLVLVALVSALCASSVAAELAEIGIQVHLTHSPFRTESGLQLGVAVSGYCRVSVAEGWTMRAELSSPLASFMPQLGIATTHAVGERLAVEAQLLMQTDFQDTFFITLFGGGRARITGTTTSRVMVSTFPLTLAGFYSSYGGFSLLPMLALNGYVDVTWWPTDHWAIGQAVGVAALQRVTDDEMLFPLGERYGLRFATTTHVGYRP